MTSLRTCQRRLAAAITGDRESARRARPLLRRGGPLTPNARLGIHRFAWFERLRGVLANDFPALERLLGERAFARLARDYLAAHPSRHPNLNQLGAQLPRFVARTAPGRTPAFAAELAALEGAMVRAFDAEALPPLAAADLAARSPASVARLRLRLQPAVRLCAWRFPVDAWLDTRDGGQRTPARRRSWTCVHRTGWHVRRMPLTRAQFRVLRALAGGVPLGRAVKLAPPGADVAAWFRDWGAAGLFVAPRR